MPFYDYRCDKCNYRFEQLQKMSDEPLLDCPQCKSKSLRRLIYAPAIIFKGAGWTPKHFSEKPVSSMP